MTKRNGRWLTVVLLAVSAMHLVGGQGRPARIQVPDEPMCPKCEILVHSSTILRVPSTSADGFPVAVRADARNRYWVFRRGDVPVVVSAEGQLVGEIGRKGSGPGEYVQPYDLIPFAQDSVMVLDSDAYRATVLEASLKPVRYVTLPFRLLSPMVVSWPSIVVASGSIASAAAAGWPLHHVSFAEKDVRTVRSFGPGDGEMRPDGILTMRYAFTSPRDRTYWSAWMYGYSLQQWSDGGELLRSLERRPAWFRSNSQPTYGTPSTPPPPFLADIAQDDEGLLWVFLRVPRRSWKDAWPLVPAGTREVPTRMIALEKMFETTIEVIDPRRGRVVARRSLDTYLLSALPGRRGAVYEVDATGSGRISVVYLELLGR